MSEDHIGVQINGVLYVKFEDAKKLREGWDKADAENEKLRAKADSIYSERNRLAVAFARMALAAGFKAGTGVDPDETKWPVVYVETPNGQVSWHIASHDADILSGLPVYEGQWDGTYRARKADWCVWDQNESLQVVARAALGEKE
jgi:hypothetical protein